jgi:hypothetical protein
MADNVGYTPGSGATVAADDIGGVLHQRVKISMGDDGSATDAPGDATNGLDVDVTRLPALAAGTNYVGRVRLTDGTNDFVMDTGYNDGGNNAEVHFDVGSRLHAFNGTTWDRVRGSTTTFKAATYAAAQTGTALWTPAAGKAVVITSLQIQSFGTTAGTCAVWFGASADTAFTRGTDASIFDGEFVPSTTNKPGVYVTFPVGCRGTADYVLRVTTTNAQSINVTVWGYEI